MRYEGIMTALVTPMREGEVDYNSLENLIEFQIKSNVDSLLFLGGTGEYVALNNKQRKDIIDFAIEKVDGRLPVIIGILSPGLGDAIEIASYAKDAGADALMPVTPYYVGPTQSGIIDFYKALDKVGLDILLYNIPHKTGVNMLPDTVLKVVEETKNVVGIKECTTNFGQMIELIKVVGDKITVLAGEEPSAVATMIYGARGAVMASANAVPEYWVSLYQKIKAGEISEAIKLNFKNIGFYKTIFEEPNPGPLKTYMNLKGIIQDYNTMIPLYSSSEKLKLKLKEMEIKK